MYNYATKHHIKYILTGSNNSTEFIRPPVEWIYMNDVVLLKDINRRFGKRQLKDYPLCGILKYKILYKYFYGMTRIYPLDYVVYDKDAAQEFLHENMGGLNMKISIMKMFLPDFSKGITCHTNLDLIREKMFYLIRFWREQ